MEVRAPLIFFIAAANHVSCILPNFGDDRGFESDSRFSELENLPVFEELNSEPSKEKSAEKDVSIEQLTKKLRSKVDAISREKSSAKSIRELEDAMKHQTWMTSSKKNDDDSMINDRRISFESAPQFHTKSLNEKHQKHIKDIIDRFHNLKLKEPITDNRISKFVFTHDADFATSKSVRDHNEEVEVAFRDFNKKLEETLNLKKKPRKNVGGKETMDGSYSKMVDFLENNIHKLKEQVPHKPVCKKHNSHSKSPSRDNTALAHGGFKRLSNSDMADIGAAPLRTAILRFKKLAHTRDGLENILLGLDRPRAGPYKRHVIGESFGKKNLPQKETVRTVRAIQMENKSS